jgi:hypothetical protein
VVRLRVYDLFVRIAKLNDEAFRMFEHSWVLKIIVTDFEVSEALLKMNLIELFKSV